MSIKSQFMLAAETTWGTAVTVTKAYEILPSTDSMYDINTIQSAGIQAGLGYIRDSRVTTSTYSASGTVVVEVPDQGNFGTILKHIMGSTVTTPTNIATTAYKQIHTPGSKDLFGLTLQYGEERLSDGTVVALTYNGGKISQAEFSCDTGNYLQCKVTWDAQNEAVATALATASYTAGAGVFPFKDAATFTFGGTASTAAGETTIASGVAAATFAKGITFTISTPIAGDRYGLGSAGTKANQFQNGFHELKGTLDAEFTNRTELYDLYRSQTSTPMQVDWYHGDAGSSNPYRFSLIVPAMRVTKADIAGYGSPDLPTQKIEWEAYQDSTGTNPLYQIKLVSKDSTAL